MHGQTFPVYLYCCWRSCVTFTLMQSQCKVSIKLMQA